MCKKTRFRFRFMTPRSGRTSRPETVASVASREAGEATDLLATFSRRIALHWTVSVIIFSSRESTSSSLLKTVPLA